MDSLVLNRMEILGELTNLMLMYHLLCFTDFVLDPELRYSIGYSFVFVMLLYIAINLFLMLRGTLTKAKANLAKKCMKKEKKKTALQKSVQKLHEEMPQEDSEEVSPAEPAKEKALKRARTHAARVSKKKKRPV